MMTMVMLLYQEAIKKLSTEEDFCLRIESVSSTIINIGSITEPSLQPLAGWGGWVGAG
jgi:hypothetical protein